MSEDEKIIERLEDTFYADLGKGIKKFQSITLYEDSIQDVRKLLDLYQKEKEKNKEIDLHYIPYEQYITKLNEANEKWKDKIMEMKRYREFELQQEYKDFENDVELQTYNKILEED